MRTLLVFAVSLTACLRSTEFKCEMSSQCGAGGQCESTGYCSVADDQCGRRADVTRVAFGRHAGVWADASWQSDSYLDQANLQEVPARLLVGLGARVELGAGLAASLAVENVADPRIEYLPLVPPPRPDLTETPIPLSDYAGFPLPGRSFYLALDWSH